MRAPAKPPRLLDFDEALNVEDDGEMSVTVAPGSADLNVNINMPGLEQDKVPSKVCMEIHESKVDLIS